MTTKYDWMQDEYDEEEDEDEEELTEEQFSKELEKVKFLKKVFIIDMIWRYL